MKHTRFAYVFSAIATLSLAFTAGCGGGEDPDNNPGVDANNQPAVCGSADPAGRVEQIFQQSCAFSTCHDDSLPQGGLDLLTDNPDSRLVNVSGNCNGLAYIAPGDPENSYLYLKITTPPSGCGSRMPIGGTPISAEDLACFEDYIMSQTGFAPTGTGHAW